MSADTEQLLRDAAARPARPLDVGELNRRRQRRRARRWATGTVAFVLAIGVVAVLAVQLAGTDRVEFAPADDGVTDDTAGSDIDPRAKIAAWEPQPDADLSPETTTIPILVHEFSCASGQSAEGRITTPQVRYTNEAVIVTIRVREMEVALCPGNPLTPFELHLDQPLGGRILLDGGVDPPAPPDVHRPLTLQDLPPDALADVVEIHLDELYEDVTPATVGGSRVFIVRGGEEVTVFLARAQHLDDEGLWWCPNEQVFVSPFHGELFDRQGRAWDGPAGRDLDRLPARLEGDRVYVSAQPIRTGEARGASGSGDASDVLSGSALDAYRSPPWEGRFCVGHRPDDPRPGW